MAHATENSKIGYITIATVHQRQEARLIAANLAAAAIECLLVDERDTAQLTFGKRGGGEIKVQVKRLDVTRSLQLLQGQGSQTSTSATVNDAAPGRVPRASFRFTGWKRTMAEAAAIIAVAGLLALLLFY
jgi:hypothetical protein